jgi:hypothetical protein
MNLFTAPAGHSLGVFSFESIRNDRAGAILLVFFGNRSNTSYPPMNLSAVMLYRHDPRLVVLPIRLGPGELRDVRPCRMAILHLWPTVALDCARTDIGLME